MEIPALRYILMLAADEPDECQEQWDLLHRRLSLHPHIGSHYITDCCQAYEEATGTMTGCD
jgi:hypothetical protein